MPLTASKGNMYPWVDFTHTHLRGRCPHECDYCYVQAMANRFPAMKKLYSGPIRLDEYELGIHYGAGRTIFIEHMNDLFAEDVTQDMIMKILAHCRRWPTNTYVFQTKNPERMREFVQFMPKHRILGTTIETNLPIPGSKAPSTWKRLRSMTSMPRPKFVTIEPIMDFTPQVLSEWIIDIHPSFVNIGADSKGGGLKEPDAESILYLIERIRKAGIEIRQKHNLERLLKRG